jgi:PAS domain S-box-containing protein
MGTTPKTQAKQRWCTVEDRLRIIIDSIPALVVSALPDGSVDFVNRHWLDYTGRSSEELQGWGWKAAIHPEDITRFLDEWRAALAGGRPFESEARVRRADGEYRWFLFRRAPERDESGAIVRWYGTGHEIEDRKRAEDHLRLVIDTTPALIHCGLPDGYLNFFNRRWLEYLDLTLEDICGWRWTEAIHPEDVAEIVRAWRTSLATGEPFEAEARVRRADGEYRRLLHRKVPLRDEQGNIVKWYGSSIDVEDRRRAEDAVRRSEAYLAEGERLSHTGSFGWSVSTGQISWSEETYRIFEYDRTIQPTLDLVLQRVHPEDQAFVQEQIDRSSHNGRHIDLEHRLLMPDGSIKHLHVVAHAVGDESSQVEFVGAVTDITQHYESRAALEKALDEVENLRNQLYKENLALKAEIDQSVTSEEIIGSSEALRRVLVHVAKVAPTDSTVLISGETGTGKELIARAIHRRSHRSTRAFVHLNCAAIPPSLVASELFGHEKGAFTGATQRRLGRFELAEGGTLFLDEIGDLPAETQIALLRVLQEREFERVGGSQPISANVRVLTATNRDLQAAVDAGTFRQDLFYRLAVFPIRLPPLRERVEDISLLVEFLTERYATKTGKKIRGIHKRTLELFQAYDWPGNIRELQNVVERAVILCDSDTLSIDESWLQGECPRPSAATTNSAKQGLGRLDPDREKEIIESALAESRGRVSGAAGAAAKLGVPRSTLESRIRSLQINKHRFKGT